MNAKIPESYKAGIQFIEGLNTDNMITWLEGELKEINHVLAGGRDDQPVQAIVNHHPHLLRETQKRLADAIGTLILSWKKTPRDWPEDAGRALLSLAAEIGVSTVKYPLQSLIKDKKAFARVAPLQAEVLRTIANLSTNDDAPAWRDLCRIHQEFSGMAFQVLARIAPEDALDLLGRLPDNETVIGSVARKLPAFVSQFEPPRTSAVLQQVSNALAHLSAASAAALSLALKESGFILPPSTVTSQPLISFKQQVAMLSFCPWNSAPLHHKVA